MLAVWCVYARVRVCDCAVVFMCDVVFPTFRGASDADIFARTLASCDFAPCQVSKVSPLVDWLWQVFHRHAKTNKRMNKCVYWCVCAVACVQNGASCMTSAVSPFFHCTCPVGWAGRLCSFDFDECSSHPCIVRYITVHHNSWYELLMPSSCVLFVSTERRHLWWWCRWQRCLCVSLYGVVCWRHLRNQRQRMSIYAVWGTIPFGDDNVQYVHDWSIDCLSVWFDWIGLNCSELRDVSRWYSVIWMHGCEWMARCDMSSPLTAVHHIRVPMVAVVQMV